MYDWETLNANAKYYNDMRRAAMKNWENKAIDIRTSDVAYTMRRQDVMRMVMMKVLAQNEHRRVRESAADRRCRRRSADAGEPRRRRVGHGYGALLGIPEVFVPAGFADTIYEPTFKLSEDGTKYESVPGTTATKLASPLPFNIAFWAGPGEEAVVLKVASAYEAATHHRKPAPGFGPLTGEP